MKTLETASLGFRLTAHDIRATAARWAHPGDPLAEWRFEFGEWRKACAELQEMEQERIVSEKTPAPLTLRQHRYLLFLLMTRGEELALHLMQDKDASAAEKGRLIDQVDAFLGTLRDSWQTWHGEALPAHREALAKFFA
jgi:hypothetical protein